MNKVLAELKQYSEMKKELEAEISKLQDECKEYMTENELSELFNDDKNNRSKIHRSNLQQV